MFSRPNITLKTAVISCIGIAIFCFGIYKACAYEGIGVSLFDKAEALDVSEMASSSLASVPIAYAAESTTTLAMANSASKKASSVSSTSSKKAAVASTKKSTKAVASKSIAKSSAKPAKTSSKVASKTTKSSSAKTSSRSAKKTVVVAGHSTHLGAGGTSPLLDDGLIDPNNPPGGK